MAAAGGRRAVPLIAALRAAPYRFDARQAALLLQQATVPGSGRRELALHAEQDRVLLRGATGFGFPPSDVGGLDAAGPDGRPALLLEGFSLGGAHGPLPAPLGRLAAERAREGDTATRDFLDLFQHRLLSLWLQHWRLFRPALQPLPPEQTDLAAWLFAVLGLGTPALRATVAGGFDRGLLAAAALLARRPVSLHALERALALQTGAAVRAQPCQGGWLALAAGQRTALGRSGGNRALGRETVLGGRVWDQQAGIRLQVGPLPLPQARALLPGTPGFAALRRLAGFALGDGPRLALLLVVQPASIPPCRLARDAAPALGWTAWLGARPRAGEGRITLSLPPTLAAG